ncbi:unnamed protein product [Lactuca saligna]|uniref:RING-type domain-containing protein n=1 Tax=Lactuca saligna TaxID=75948 RepID=A0AA36EI04_LACSI|nr:unnamed protein product [Lactuca saligna]
MGLEDADLVDDGDAAGGGKAALSVSCSICLEVVTDNGDRGWAKLQCGHQFHLDCIGSAFNVKGVMQCPNCRKIEKGQWLYANGCRPYPEFSMDDWTHDEDLYDLSYSESSMWCPFGGFTRLAASFDEGEFPTTAYHDLLGQHAIFTEHAAVSSATHLCPYIAYVQPVHPSSSSSSTSSASVGDGHGHGHGHGHGGTYNNQWNNSQSASSEMPNSYGLPTMDVRYHTTLFPTSTTRLGGAAAAADQPSMSSLMPRRPLRSNADMPRSGGSYVHPFLLGQSSSGRAPSAVGSSMIHPYPGSAARARERSQALQAYFQQPSNLPGLRTPIVSGSRRSNNPPQIGGPAGSSSDQLRGGGVYFLPTSGAGGGGGSSNGRAFQEAESSMQPNPFHHGWERDPHAGWGFHQAGGGGGGGGGGVFRQRHGSDRTPGQGHYRS